MNYNRKVFNYNHNVVQNDYFDIQRKRLINHVYVNKPNTDYHKIKVIIFLLIYNLSKILYCYII